MIVSQTRINTNLSKYDTIDESLITSKNFIRNFGLPEDYVEAHIYTNSGSLLIFSDYDYKGYTIPGSLQGDPVTLTDELGFEPGKLVESIGYAVGKFQIEYNILRKKIFNTNKPVFFIKEISSDRTELRISTNDISNSDVENGTLNFINEIQNAPYFKDFILNFSDNKLVNAVNIVLDKNTDPYNILVKLYQSLPSEFDVKSSFWFVEEISAPIVYEVEIFPLLSEDKVPQLRSANFDIDVDQHSIKPSNYYNEVELLSTTSLNSFHKLMAAMKNKGIQINVDYSDYSNFIHFSSAKQRLLNFVYKIGELENYNTDISSLQTIPYYSSSINTSHSIYNIQSKINNIITNFDGYEQYLYFTSESAAWPKVEDMPPYTLYSVTSSQVYNWLGSDDYNSPVYGGQLYTASYYDNDNYEGLVHSVPEFIGIDERNDQYLLFIDMMGQHFDNIWLYIKSITDQYNNTSDLTKGISKDLVYYALRSLGIKLYNSKSNDDLFNYFIGSSVSGSYTPTGSSYETLVTSSALTIPGQDLQKELLKRIYHNLPLLLKSKGTVRGAKALITSFGIPSTILDVVEFGGADKTSATVEYTYDRFSYSLNVSSSAVATYWMPMYDYTASADTAYPVDSIELRFKPEKHTYYSTQSLIELGDSTPNRNLVVDIQPDFISGFPYSTVTTYLSGSAGFVSSSLSVPLYHTSSTGEMGWWNIMVKRRYHIDFNNTASDQYYDTYVKNKVDLRLGHQASSSIAVTGSGIDSYNYAWSKVYNNYIYIGGSQYPDQDIFKQNDAFVGNLQELRFWYEPLNETSFDKHVLNPESYQGNDSGSKYFSALDYRFPLGNDLITYNNFLTSSVDSVDPNYKIRLTSTAAYRNLYFMGFHDENNYVTNKEQYVTDSPNSVYANPVNQKIRIVNNYITGSVLSPFIRMEDETEMFVTKDTHFVDASFSPQNEINKDIISQYGSNINLDELIGNPREMYNNEYADLESLRGEYYSKFLSRYNVKDYIKLIQYFDNSLFKMLLDYVPGRSNLQTGITIKSPILERPKAKMAEPILTENYNYFEADISGSSISGDSTYTSGLGDGSDFYTGELSGSELPIYDNFLDYNHNKYLDYDPNMDINKFNHSDFNTMVNNVMYNRESLVFKRLDPYNLKISESVQLQDSLYMDPAYTGPRYDGVKSTSAVYNFYTTGDKSYGKNAAIDRNSYKLGWVKNIPDKMLNFYDKTSINIKYLIDTEDNITELSYANKNLVEVQNTFKSGTPVIVSISDVQSPSNQTTLDGTKTIFKGGYSFNPILFRDADETLYFNYTQSINPRIQYLAISASCTSSFQYLYSGPTSHVIPPSQPANNVPGDLAYYYYKNGSIIGTTGIPMSNNVYQTSSWNYQSISTLSILEAGTITFDISAGTLPITWANNRGYAQAYGFDIVNFSQITFNNERIPHTYESFNGGQYYYKVPRASSYAIHGEISMNLLGHDVGSGGPAIFRLVGILEKSTNPTDETSWAWVGNTTLSVLNGLSHGNMGYNSAESALFYENDMTSPVSLKLSYSQTVSLAVGDYIRFRFYWIDCQNAFDVGLGASNYLNFTILPNSKFSISDNVNYITVYDTSGSYDQTNHLFNITSVFTSRDALLFNSSANRFFDSSSFQPNLPISDYYSQVVDIFKINQGDLIRFGQFDNNNPNYYTVKNVNIVGGNRQVIVDPSISVIDSSYADRSFAILRANPDETSVIINFSKASGSVSQTMLIPYDASKELLTSASAIFKDNYLKIG